MRARKLYEGEGEGTEEEEDAKAWVEKSRTMKKKSKQKGRNAADIIASRYEEEEEEHMSVEYTEKDLAGLKVDRAALEHVAEERGIHHEGEGGVVLTLADKSILDSDSEDELENVQIAERERILKNKKLAGKGKKKDEIMREDEDELTGLKEKKILSKYDDEYGEEEKDERFATLDGTGGVQKDAEEIRKRNARELKLRMAGLVRGELTSAEVSKTATQTDAYTKEEEELMKFNSKKKKKGKEAKKISRRRCERRRRRKKTRIQTTRMVDLTYQSWKATSWRRRQTRRERTEDRGRMAAATREKNSRLETTRRGPRQWTKREITWTRKS